MAIKWAHPWSKNWTMCQRQMLWWDNQINFIKKTTYFFNKTKKAKDFVKRAAYVAGFSYTVQLHRSYLVWGDNHDCLAAVLKIPILSEQYWVLVGGVWILGKIFLTFKHCPKKLLHDIWNVLGGPPGLLLTFLYISNSTPLNCSIIGCEKVT